MIFFVTYLMNELCKFIHRNVSKIIRLPEELIILSTYSLLILFIIFVGTNYTPIIINQAKGLTKIFDEEGGVYKTINNYVNSFLDHIDPNLRTLLISYNFDTTKKISELSSGLISISYEFLKSIGIWIFNTFLIIILSLFFLLEKNQMKKFVEIFKNSKTSFVYYELHPVFLRFYKAFGTVIKAQILISLIITLLTIIPLAIMKFPNLFALGLMIFLFGLIPVVGAIISTIPLLIIGFKIGGFSYVFYIIVIVLAIHTIGGYLIFPKIISNFIHLPVFIIMVVLLISEHFFGAWGLIYGLPLFVFILESIKESETNMSDLDSTVINKNPETLKA